MKIKIEIENTERIKEAKNALDEIISMNLENKEMELTEENLKRAKEIKDICSKGWVRAEIKIVSTAGTELTKLF